MHSIFMMSLKVAVKAARELQDTLVPLFKMWLLLSATLHGP